MSLSSFDLPLEALTTPQWWSVLVYRYDPKIGWVEAGYSKPVRQKFYDHVGTLQDLSRANKRAVSWIYWKGEWVKA